MHRRHFVRGLLSGAMLPALGCEHQRVSRSGASFEHGVASGDPLADRVILWTRVSGPTDRRFDVAWYVATDREMRNVIRQGSYTTGPHRDNTVKVDAAGLPSGRRLFYQFEAEGVRSPVGRTNTLPAYSIGNATFAVVSCSNYPYGYFHAYRDIAQRDDIDAVLHLGDYIYEYGMGGYATERAETLGRVPDPIGELVSLGDYRRRHAQYKADPDSIAMHAAHPLIAIWDDHELANDAWRNGAQNHQPEEGSWENRRDAAIRAWLEWMPVRARHDRGQTEIFRDYRYGDLLTLIMLDTRLIGRDLQPDAIPDPTPERIRAALGDPERELLGTSQKRWLETALQRAASSRWQIVAQQVMVSPTRSPELGPLLDPDGESMLSREQIDHYIAQSRGNPPLLLDTWNGYPAAREHFLGQLATLARNPVVLSGDLHTSLAGNLVPQQETRPVAVEFMTGSVASPGFAEYLPERQPGAVRDATLAVNPSLRYMETERRGWMRLEVGPDACTAEWHLLDTVHSRDYRVDIDRRLAVFAGRVDEGLVPA